MQTTVAEVEQIMSQPVCTVEEAAKVLHIGRGHAYNAVKSGELRSIRIGRRVLVPTEPLRQLLATGPAQSAV